MDATTIKKYTLFLKIGYVCLVLFPIASVILCYVIRSDVRESPILPSHCNWQIKTFWVSFALVMIGYIITMTLVGALVGLPLLFGVFIWCIYRAIKGFLALEKNSAIGLPNTTTA